MHHAANLAEKIKVRLIGQKKEGTRPSCVMGDGSYNAEIQSLLPCLADDLADIVAIDCGDIPGSGCVSEAGFYFGN